MNQKKTIIPTSTVTRDMMKISEDTGNVYETVAIIAKRSNQIAIDMKADLEQKLQDYATTSNDTSLEDVFENSEQIEISKYYERMPKPVIVATEAYIAGDVYHRNANEEKKETND